MRTRSWDESIVRRVNDGSTVVYDYQPGNATRYVVAVTRIEDRQAALMLGHGPVVPVWIVALLSRNQGAMTVGREYVHTGYVAEKLRCNDADADVLAELIAHVTGNETNAARGVEL